MTKARADRASTGLRCGECGTTVLRWVGRCPECQAWGTIAEAGTARELPRIAARPGQSIARPIDSVEVTAASVVPTGMAELDRVLGGGLVPGSVVLLAGEPGIGKSTLLLAVAHAVAQRSGPALIVTGEESVAQVRLRAERTGTLHPNLYLAAENDLSAVLGHVDTVQPTMLVVDSVQTIAHPLVEGTAGGVPQIRAVAGELTRMAKERGITTVLIGHVTKDGSIAGPRLLEHIVDVVVQIDGERRGGLRLVRASKNRFGNTDEVGCFELRDSGVVEVADPGELFLSDRNRAVAGTCVGVSLEGRRPLVAEIQALVTASAGSARRSVNDVDPARVAMITAVLSRHARLALGDQDVYVSSVGGFDVREPAMDLAIALAIASAARELPLPMHLCAMGEVSLSGDVRVVGGLARRLAECARLGFRIALIPANAELEFPIEGMRLIRVEHIADAMQALGGLRSDATATRRVLRAVTGGEGA